jgi:aminoglycoside phosphotransferase family enzyme/predicted kinase
MRQSTYLVPEESCCMDYPLPQCTDNSTMTMTAMQRGEHLVEALHNPQAYEHPVAAVHVMQTHTAWVLLTGKYAYKIKKPVDFGFLDFSTLEKRRHWCEEEVRLNQRFAPDIYLGVTEIRGTLKHPHTGGSGPVLEYAVHMRQFPDKQLLSDLAEYQQLEASHIDQLSEKIAAFHQTTDQAAPDSEYGQPARIQHWVRENFQYLLPNLKTDKERKQLEHIRQWTHEQGQQLEQHFEARKRNGFIRECHGDLHLRNLTIIDGAITLFDCIEFNAELRWIDVISEVAFLIMDLEEHGYPHFGHQFLNRYLQLTGDYEGLRGLPYYLVYRALVRAKVAILRREQVSPQSKDYLESTAEYRHYMQFVLQHIDKKRPVLFITHGLSGSGKSTLGRALNQAKDIIQIRSDIERKRLSGLKASERHTCEGGTGLYGSQRTEETYQRLAELAVFVIEAGFSVLLDATFLKENHRDLMRQLADTLQVPFLILLCVAPNTMLEERIHVREDVGQDPSDASIQVLEAQRDKAQPLRTDEGNLTVTVDTSQENYVQTLLKNLDERL